MPNTTNTENTPDQEQLAKISAQIAALIARAESTNHEPERIVCIERVESLMLKHSITAAMLNAQSTDAPTKPTSRSFVLRGTYLPKRRQLLSSVASAFACPVLVMSKGADNTQELRLFGMINDLDFVAELYESLANQMFRALRTQPISSIAFRTSFMNTFCVRVSERLHKRYQEELRQAESSQGLTSASSDLVLRNRLRDAEQLLHAEFPQTRSIRHSSTSTDLRGRHAGHHAGENADISLNGHKIDTRRKELRAGFNASG